MREEAVFNGVVLGTVGRIVSNADFDADFISQFLEVGFEEVMPGVIAAATIAKN